MGTYCFLDLSGGKVCRLNKLDSFDMGVIDYKFAPQPNSA